jgi:uncharacterized protein YxjI
MPGPNDAALSLRQYIVERKLKSVLSMELTFSDDKGNTVLVTKGKALVARQTIETPSGGVLCTITHKILSLMPMYEIHEGGADGQVIGIVKQNFTLGTLVGQKNVAIEDASGQQIAVANGDFLGFEFNVTSNGATIATVTKNVGSGIMQGLGDLMRRKYSLSIIGNSEVPTLTLLGFLVVLEMLQNRQSGGNRGVVNFGGGGLKFG